MKKNISDPQVQEICTQLQRTAQMMLENKRIFAGNKDIPDSPKGNNHHGQYEQLTDVIHIDEDFLDAAIAIGALQSIGAIVLHEAAHKDRFDHPDEEEFPYTSFPFKHTSFTRESREGIKECM